MEQATRSAQNRLTLRRCSSRAGGCRRLILGNGKETCLAIISDAQNARPIQLRVEQHYCTSRPFSLQTR